MKSIKEMMAVISPEKTGGVYCNAIDEDHYDSSQWENHMPGNGYSFYENKETDKVEVSYTHYFACWDGYDSMEDDCGTYNSMEEAVTKIYTEIVMERLRSELIGKLTNMAEIELGRDNPNIGMAFLFMAERRMIRRML